MATYKTYKLVDTFNGWEGDRHFQRIEEAETALHTRRQDFYAHPGNHNARFCGAVVESGLTWTYDPRANKFRWW